ncbi:unnamed protein product [Oikopleura dioica]|uniref:RING-type domain-containing protein n=1 Tax=Oikopleura dioica TaxID=34765 RepID=E4XGE3_OIKDI|nr:unnamed protein product [Oikopleura dioica]
MSIDDCPICLEHVTELKTSCGHRFCKKCLIQVWESGRLFNAITCPLCRTEISTLEPDEEKPPVDPDDRIALYNWKFSTNSSWKDCVHNLPILLRLALRDFWHLCVLGARDQNTGTELLAFFAFLFVHILLYLSSFSFIAFIMTILVVFIPLFFHILFVQIDND